MIGSRRGRGGLAGIFSLSLGLFTIYEIGFVNDLSRLARRGLEARLCLEALGRALLKNACKALPHTFGGLGQGGVGAARLAGTQELAKPEA